MAERTTVRLPDDLLRRARKKAAQEKRTLTSLIEEGLRIVISGEAPQLPARRYARISQATGGPLPGVDFPRLRDLDEEDDIERFKRIESQYRASKE
jgi:hypothetical protein